MKKKFSVPQPLLFAFIRIPYGVFLGFVRIPLPFLLRKENVSVDKIAEVVSFVLLPAAFYFLWSPLVDFKFGRRYWLLFAAFASAALLAFALLGASLSASNCKWIMLVAFTICLLTSAASGGLIASILPKNGRERSTGWYQAGTLGASAFGGGVLLYLAERITKTQFALCAFVLIAIPALSSLLMREPPAVPQSTIPLGGQLKNEFQSTFWTKRNIVGILLILAPIGTDAAAALWSGMAVDYHITGSQLSWISGVGGAIFVIAGALLGGYLPAQYDKRAKYVCAGILNALASMIFACGPVSQTIYFLGFGIYQFTIGICYTCLTSLVLEMLGEAGISLSTRYTILISLSNIPVIYMTWMEGHAFSLYGNRAVSLTDAGGNLIIAAIFGVYFFNQHSKVPIS